jgi:hypothetical protein
LGQKQRNLLVVLTPGSVNSTAAQFAAVLRSGNLQGDGAADQRCFDNRHRFRALLRDVHENGVLPVRCVLKPEGCRQRPDICFMVSEGISILAAGGSYFAPLVIVIGTIPPLTL